MAKRQDWVETDGTVASVEPAGRFYSVVFTYKVDGSWYSGTFIAGTPMQPGEFLPVQYDPSDPEKNNYLRSQRWSNVFYVIFLVGMAVLAVYLSLQKHR